MKLQNELERVTTYTKNWIAYKGEENVKAYMQELKASGEYQNYEVRVANDVVKYGALYHTIGVNGICEWYEMYQCNDKHITTLCIEVMKKLNLL